MPAVNALHNKLATLIRTHGPISVADYMHHCLLDPEHGYYTTRQVFGTDGDFTTAPEISQIFGDLLGFWVIDLWHQLGQPSPFILAELGPGQGTLMADILRQIAKIPALLAATELHLIEASPRLQSLQREKIPHPLTHHTTLETLPTHAPILLLANEFFDALPIHQYCGETERRVTLTETGDLAFTPQSPVTAETCPAALSILDTLAPRLITQTGALLIIDYGYITPLTSRVLGKAEGPHSHDTLQALRAHTFHPVLETPGQADLTAHVDFATLATHAASLNLTAHGPTPQGRFLQSLGGDLWLQKLLPLSPTDKRETLHSAYLRLISPTQMGSLFKTLALSSPSLTPAGF